jgi:hypothetical protein
VEYCPSSALWGGWARVLSYRSGLAVSGCVGTIEWFQRNAPTSRGVRGEGDFVEVISLGDGWAAIMDCT